MWFPVLGGMGPGCGHAGWGSTVLAGQAGAPEGQRQCLGRSRGCGWRPEAQTCLGPNSRLKVLCV